MTFFDTHIHLYSEEYNADLDSVIRKAEVAGVSYLYLPAIDSTTHGGMMELCDKYHNCRPMIGLHPCSVKENYLDEIAIIKKMLAENKFFAIGETGIDLYWDKQFFPQQQDALLIQIEMAIENDLPIVLHTRNSIVETIDMIEPFAAKGLRGVFHCFSGDINQAQKVIDMGFYLGIGGVVTYKNSLMAEVVKEISLESLVLETDGPYLSPVPFRGKRNESSYIPIIAQKIADLKKVTIEEVSLITTANARELFRDYEAT